MSARDVGRIGEEHIVNQLKRDGYTIIDWDTTAPGATDIEAQKGPRHILVQVKTAIYPNEPDSLSPDELQKIKSRASKLRAEAWEAKVQVQCIPMGNPSWRQL